jgi:Ca-activated chloride channel homolog
MLFSFNNPQYLPILFLVFLIWIIHFFTLETRKKKALNFANFEAISRIEGVDFFSRNFIIPFLSSLILIFLILSVSGTNIHFNPFQGSSFYSFIIAFDNSRSMSANDFDPDRLTVSKESAINFVKEIPVGSKVGIVSFSSFTYIEKEITDNKEEVINSINNIDLSEYGGTNIYEMVITSSNLLKNQKNKAIILISDGQNNLGEIDKIIDYANREDISISSIALGTKEGGLTLDYSMSKLNEDFLQNLSKETGGNYFSAENLEEIVLSFSQILKLTKEKTSLDLSTYFLLFAIILFIIEFFVINTKYFY